MRNKGLIAIFLIILFTAAGALADEMLAWQDCAEEAKVHHPDLVSAAEKLNQSMAAASWSTPIRTGIHRSRGQA